MQTEKFKLRKNIQFSIISFCINLFLVFLSYRLIINSGGIELLGLWSTLYAWVSLTKIGDVGMAGANLRFVSMLDPDKDSKRLKSVIDTGVAINFVIFSIVTICGYFISLNLINSTLDNQHIETAKQVLPILFLGFFLFNFSTVLLASLQGMHLGYIGSQLNITGTLCQLLLAYALIPKLGLIGMAWAQVAQYLLITIASSIILFIKAGTISLFPHSFCLSTFREMIGFSSKFQISNIANGLFEPISKIIVGKYGGMAAQGIFELAYKSLWLPRTAIVSGTTATIPALTSLLVHDNRKAEELYKKSKNLTFKMVLLLSTLIVIFSPLISYIWLGEILADYSIYLGILSIGVLVNTYGASAYNLAICSGNIKNNIIVNTCSTACLVLLLNLVDPAINIYTLILLISLVMSTNGALITHLNEKNILYSMPGLGCLSKIEANTESKKIDQPIPHNANRK